MAVTRATSRAFRQQYSWIMALAGYEPTPADEMPQGDQPKRGSGFVSDTPHGQTADGGLIGTAEVGKARDSDFETRQTPDGFALGFKLKSNGGGFKVLTRDELALQLADAKDKVVGQRVTVFGRVRDQTDRIKGRDITYQVIDAERVQTPVGLLPILRRDPEDEVIAPAPGQEAFDLAAVDAETDAT